MFGDATKRSIAKQIIEGEFNRGLAVKYISGKTRVAIVEAYVFGIIRLQDTESVKVAAMDDLLDGVKTAIEAKMGHGFFE